MNPWILAQLDLENSAGTAINLLAAQRFLGEHRHKPQIDGCVQGHRLWLRANTEMVKDAAAIFSRLPGAEVYSVDQQDRLILLGKSVPSTTLPEVLEWLPLEELAPLRLPDRSALQERTTVTTVQKTALRWIQADLPSEPGGMLCSYRNWSDFVLRNFQHRWRSLRFARRSAVGNDPDQPWDTLVIGEHLPSIPGVRLLCTDQILIPIPFHWYPAVPAQAIRKAHHVQDGDLLLWRQETRLELIRDEELIATSRSSVRATEELV